MSTTKMTADERRQRALERMSDTELAQRKAELQKQLAQLNRAAEGKRRAAETRKKVLVGAMYLKKAADDPQWNERLMKALDAYLSRDDDRALFGLPPAPSAPETPEDQLTAAQRLTLNAADHGDPGRVLGHAQESPKNAPEQHDVDTGEGQTTERKRGWFSAV